MSNAGSTLITRHDVPRLQAWHALLAVAVVGVVFGGALPRIAAYEDVWSRLWSLQAAELFVLAAAAAWNVLTYLFVLVAALPGLTLRQAAISSQASTAVSNVVPGGGAWGAAVTWAMYRRWGFARADSARALMLTAIWNNFFKLGLPLAAFGLAALSHGDAAASLSIGIVSTAVLGLSVGTFVGALRSPGVARALGSTLGSVVSKARRAVGRAPVSNWDERSQQLRLDAAELVGRRWIALTAATVVSHVSLFLVLLTSLRVLGVGAADVTWLEALAAFALVRVALLVPVTPGGAGLTELGLSGALVAVGGSNAEVVAAVLLFRALTWLLPVGSGVIAYLVWRVEVASERERIV